MHPGEFLRVKTLPSLKLSINEAAQRLGVSRITLSRVLNGHCDLSPEMCVRLEKLVGGGRSGSAEIWHRMQGSYDLWKARQALSAKVGG